MTTHIAETSPIIHARVTALLVLAIFGLLYIPFILTAPTDAGTTANYVIASETRFRLGIVSNLIVQVAGVFWVLVLYRLLKSVNKDMSLLMVIFYSLSVPIALINELNKLAVLLVLHPADYLTVFTQNQLHALVPLFLNLHDQGNKIAGIFWGLWLFPLGYLIFKSNFLPRILGILLILGCFSFLAQSFAGLLLPNFGVNIVALTDWGELFLPLWLLIKGVNVEQWKKSVLGPA